MKHKILLIYILNIFLLSGCQTMKPAPVSSIKPDYSEIDKGSYASNSYRVNAGETLYFIAYVSGITVEQLINYNNLQVPYTIYPGQLLRVKPRQNTTSRYVKNNNSEKLVKKTVMPNGVTIVRKRAEKAYGPRKLNKSVVKPQKKVYTKINKRQVLKKTSKKNIYQSSASIGWSWPTKGKIVEKFTSTGTNKGVNISGSKGQGIYAAAPGKVVYAGSALRGYGNIVIIKHNTDYLSAYAHNESLLVKENQTVKSGQKIALMGNTASSIVQLHFEIRYKGKSVDPLRYLP